MITYYKENFLNEFVIIMHAAEHTTSASPAGRIPPQTDVYYHLEMEKRIPWRILHDAADTKRVMGTRYREIHRPMCGL